MMQRRSFLKGLGAGLVAIFAPLKALSLKSKASEELGCPMVYTLRRRSDYQSIGRKLLMVDELPQGAYARYKKDVRSIIWTSNAKA